jgi:hypothetical protein
MLVGLIVSVIPLLALVYLVLLVFVIEKHLVKML